MKRKFTGVLFILLLPLLTPQVALANGTWTCDEFMGSNCGEAINDVFMVAPNEAWAVGDYGTILHKVNGEWLRVDSPTTGNLNRLKMVTDKQGKTVGWAVGDDVTLIYYDGSTWSQAPFVGNLPNADQGADLFDLDLLDAENGWAVGVYGWQNDFYAAIFLLKDGAWEDYAESLYFNDIEMVSASDGWAVGEGGRIMHYDGAAWERVPSPVDVDLYALDMIAANEGWAVGRDGHILHYLNGTWSLQDNSDYAYYHGIDMVSADYGWAVGNTGHNMRYQDGTWTLRLGATGNLRAVDMVTASNGWAVGTAGQIHHYNGTSWELDTDTPKALNTLQMLSANEGWAMGGDSSPHIQYYNGSTWSNESYSGGGGAVLGLDMVTDSDGWAVGEDGLILHYQSGNWVQASSPVSVTLRSVDMVSAAEGWAVGDGVILHYTGGNWEVYADTTPIFDEELYALDIVSPDDIWAVGDRGGIVHWDGIDWAMETSPIYDPASSWNELLDIDMVAADQGWATGTAEIFIDPYLVITPVLLHYAGNQWQLWGLGGGGDFVQMLSATEGWFGYDDALYHFQDQNSIPEDGDFSPIYAPQGVYGVHFFNLEEGMGVSDDGSDLILHYHDGKWYDEQIARHINLEDVNAVSLEEAWAVGSYDFRFTDSGGAILHFVDDVWIDYSKDPPLFDLDMPSTNDGWAVGGDERSGAIYRYDGTAWQRVLTPNYRLNAIHMLNGDEGWAVGYNGTIHHYAAGNWQEVPSPTSLELFDVFAVAANDVWAVGQDGRILHFDGSTWALYESPTDGQIYTIQMVSPTEGWALGNGAAIHYQDGVWSNFTSGGTFYDLDMLSADEGWAVGWNDISYYDGANWSGVEVPFNKRWRGVDMVSADEGWIVGEDGLILRYYGGNWQIAGGPTAGDLQAVEMLSADEGWAIGNGTILHYLNGSWQVVIGNRPTEKELYGIDMTANGSSGWAVGQDGVMLRYQNDRWEKALSATSNQLNAVQLLSDSVGWAVGNNGTILKFNGSNWQYTGNPVNKNLNDLAMQSATNGWAVGDGATLLQFDGANWNTVASPTIGDITAIGMSDSSFGWAGISTSLLNFDAGSWQWVGYGSPSISPYAIKTLDRKYAWAVGENASDSPIIHYAGDAWNFYASPTHQTLYGLSFPTASHGWAMGENVILRYHGPDMDQRLFLPLVSK